MPPRRSVRAFLAWLILACLLPGVLGAGILLVHVCRNRLVRIEKGTILTARALVQTVDTYLSRAQVAAQALASSRSLARLDFADFHRQAREVLAVVGPGTNFVLSDPSGQQIVNTAREFGTPVPRHGSPGQVRRVFATGRPAISDVFYGEVLRRPVMSIDVPVVLAGKVTYVLGVGIVPDHFDAILHTQGLPRDWVAAILDRTGTMETRTRDGIPVLAVHSRSPVSNWRVGIGIPRRRLATPLFRSPALLGLGVVALFWVRDNGAGFKMQYAD